MTTRLIRIIASLVFLSVITPSYGKKNPTATEPLYTFVAMPSFKKAEEEFKHAQATTLFVFDIDGTLIEPADLSFKQRYTKTTQPSHFIPATDEARFSFTEDLFNIHRFLKKHSIVAELIAEHQQQELIEPDIVLFIKQLRKKNIPVIALSAFTSSQLPGGSRTEKKRYEDLKELGILFEVPHHLFPNRSEQRFNYSSNNSLSGVRYYRGIIASNDQNKGFILSSFVQLLLQRPEKVVFFDNQLNNIDDVAFAMKKLRIPTTCYYVTNTYQEPTIPLDTQVAHYQFEYIKKNSAYISYEEAKKRLLEKKPLVEEINQPKLSVKDGWITLPGAVETE